ncbi:hypothetical protein [Nocardia panacis]|uniref:hypothetical protein n=1 Tax=Nocardia panacis TaxID=2340916 RepID=UPI0013153F11|nr:hypothetical protein [Nocardia panacis]
MSDELKPAVPERIPGTHIHRALDTGAKHQPPPKWVEYLRDASPTEETLAAVAQEAQA